MDRIMVIVSFLVLLGAIFIPGAIKASRGGDIQGSSPINKMLFVAGKALMITCWSFMIAQAFGFELIYWSFPPLLRYAGIVLLVLSLSLIIPPNFYRGFNFSFGLAREKERLVTTGVYSFTRNPYYLGMYMTMIGSFLYVPNPVNLICGIVSIAIHHKIILAEEKHLLLQHGGQYRDYLSKVRRYF